MKLPVPTPDDLRQLSRVRRGENVLAPGSFLKAVRSEAIRRAAPEEAAALRTFLSRSGGADVATVQVATEPDAALRKEMTRSVSSDGDTLVRIRVYRDLLGGMRLFRNGTLSDASWRAKVRSVLGKLKKLEA